MNVTFYISMVESIGVEILSAILKKDGHKVNLVFNPNIFDSEAIQNSFLKKKFSYKEYVIRQIIESKPDLLCFSTFTIGYQGALEIARAVKKEIDVSIIFGGIHPTLVPERVITQNCIDMVCIGEGEGALSELVNSFQNNERRTDIKNIWFKKNGKIIKNEIRPLLQNLDEWPLPDKQSFYAKQPIAKKDYGIVSSLGCAYRCTYCSNNALMKIYSGKGKYLRKRSVDHVINELKFAKKQFNPKRVTFLDDFFISSLKWLEEFSIKYKKEINLPFVAMAHPKYVTSKTAKLLKDAGCFWLIMGVQSTSEKIRKDILWRVEKLEDIKQAAKECHKVKLNFSVDHILSIPFEPSSALKDAMRFYNDIRPHALNSYWLQYFPKSEIINFAIQDGKLTKEDIDMIEEGKASASMVIGIGKGDSTISDKYLKQVQLIFMLIPLLPKKFMDRIITKGYIFSPNFAPPIILNIFIKIICSIRVKRTYVYTGLIQNLFYYLFKLVRYKLPSFWNVSGDKTWQM